MNYSQYTKSLEQNVCPAYIFVGDGFLVQKALNELYKVINLENTEMDISVFDSENFSASQIIEACEQISFFNTKRVVVVKNISSLKDKEKSLFESYLKNPNPATILILIDNDSQGVFDGLKCETVDLKNIGESEINTFCVNIANSCGKQIDSNAITFLSECCLKNLDKMELEIKKISDYLGDTKKQITKEEISLLVSADEEIIVFELTTALCSKNANKATEILSKLMGAVDQNAKLFALISNSFRRMFLCCVSKQTKQELAKELGVKEYAVTKSLEQAKLFGAKKLKNICEQITECDYMIKSGQMSQDNAMYYLLFKILYM